MPMKNFAMKFMKFIKSKSTYGNLVLAFADDAVLNCLINNIS